MYGKVTRMRVLLGFAFEVGDTKGDSNRLADHQRMSCAGNGETKRGRLLRPQKTFRQ